MKKYDAILYIDNEELINEDERNIGTKSTDASMKGFKVGANWDDPALYNAFSFGQRLRSGLNDMGKGFSCDVTDFKKWVVVKMNHHDIISGRTSSKTFLVVFKHKGDGVILSTHNRYRSISGPDQAISYIRSAASVLQSSNSSKI